MLANEVSPASLCGNAIAGHPEMSVAGHGLPAASDGGEPESQQSQASLFNSGSSELANSMELFSQPSSASSHSQHSQTHSLAQAHTVTGAQHSREDDRGMQNGPLDSTEGKQQSQRYNKYYMRYLSSTSLSSKPCTRRQQPEAVGSTPPTVGVRQGDTAHSKAAFDMWKSKQQEKLEKQKLIEEVISTSSSSYTKELKQTLENLRIEIKEALSLPNTTEIGKGQVEILTHSLLSQILQGQDEIKGQLTDLKTMCSQQRQEIAALKVQVASLEGKHATAIQSTLSSEVTSLEKTLVRPLFCDLQEQLSHLFEQLNSLSHKQSEPQSAVREEDSGLGSTQVDHHTQTDVLSTHSHSQAHSGSGEACGGKTPIRKIQSKRKRKNSSVPRNLPSQSLSTSHSKSKEKEVGGPLAHSDLSTQCAINITQHSPSGCSQILNGNIRENKHKKCSQQTRESAISLPPSREPVAKRKRCTGGYVSRQKATGVHRNEARVLTTPRATRQSQRLSKHDVKPTCPYSSSDEECVKPELEDQQKSVDIRNGVDVLDDWLDFKPPRNTQDSADSLTSLTEGVRFQRSSEAAKRRLVITEQMSATLATSDLVLRELLLSDHLFCSP